MQNRKPLIVGIGGTTRDDSSSEVALRLALQEATSQGANVATVCGRALVLPMFDPSAGESNEHAAQFVRLIRKADGLIVSTPGYHGSFSGMIKNALDYVEELRADDRPYLEGRAVGMIVCAYGWQATGTTLSSLRSVIHALRGWPTPLGVSINTSVTKFPGGRCEDESVTRNLAAMARQVVDFATFSCAKREAVKADA